MVDEEPARILYARGGFFRLCQEDGRVPVEETPYEELEHVRITREFLADPQRYFRHLLDE